MILKFFAAIEKNMFSTTSKELRGLYHIASSHIIKLKF